MATSNCFIRNSAFKFLDNDANCFSLHLQNSLFLCVSVRNRKQAFLRLSLIPSSNTLMWKISVLKNVKCRALMQKMDVKEERNESLEEVVKYLTECFSEKENHGEAKEPNFAETVKLLFSLGASRSEMLRMFRRNPHLLTCPTDQIFSVQDCLTRYGIQPIQILNLLTHHPHLLAKNPSEIDSISSFLKSDLGIKNLSRIISAWPSIFTLHPSEIASKVEFYREMGLNPKKMLSFSPILLNYRNEEVRYKVGFYRTLLRGDDRDVVQLFSKHPALLFMKIQTVRDTYERFVDMFGESSTLKILRKHPGVLQKSWPTAEKKIHYIVHTMSRGLEEVRQHPVVLLYSLERRIKPRFEALQLRGMENNYGLSTMFCISNSEFEARFGIRLDV